MEGCTFQSKSKKTLFNVGQCKQYNISSHLKWVLVADKKRMHLKYNQSLKIKANIRCSLWFDVILYCRLIVWLHAQNDPRIGKLFPNKDFRIEIDIEFSLLLNMLEHDFWTQTKLKSGIV